MSQATQPSRAAAEPGTRKEQATAVELTRLLAQCTSMRAAYAAGLGFLAEKFGSPYAALKLDVDSGTVEEHLSSNDSAQKSWSRHCDGMMLSSRYHQTSQARFFQAEGIDQTFAVLTTPLSNQRDGSIGAVAVVILCDRRDLAAARLSELQAIAAVIDMQAEAARRTSRSAPESSVLAKVAAHESLEEFCFALTNSLKSNLSCDQVALGLVRGNSVKLACVSGFDDLYPRSPGSQLIQQAMCECLDAGEVVCYQVDGQSDSARVATGHHLHKQWYASLGASPVASIPLFVNEACAAIISLRNPGGRPFSQRQLAKVQELVAPMTPGLLLLERANRSAVQRAGEAVGAFGRSLIERGSVRRKLLAAMLLALGTWIVFGKIQYCPSASCIVEPTDDIQLSAPFEGTIAESYVQPGDLVVAGQKLAQMDTRNLASECERLLSELRRAEVATVQASQLGDVTGAARAHAEAAIARAQIQVIRQKLKAAALRAPEDGVILDGRLEPRLGEVVALGEPLLRFAPRGQWKVNLHVPDHLAIQIQRGQLAQVAISARPEAVSSLRIEQINAASQVEQGQNVFTAEARFEGNPPDWLRAGMAGVARVEVGPRPVWWVWAHRVVDSVRLRLWKM